MDKAKTKDLNEGSTGPKLILNFGHPLSDRAKREITASIGPNSVVWVRVQLDPNATISEQMIDICRDAVATFGRPDYVIMPGLAIAAVYVDRFFSRAEDDFPPVITYTPIIRLVMISNSMPPAFTFGGIE